MAQGNFKYDAFLSYATEADYDLARNLEDFLERFHELPTPVELPLRPLSIWRDGSDVSIGDARSRGGITSILENALAECRYLVLLWSQQSRRSTYMRFELEWFLQHREVGSIRVGITDARDPDPDSSELFLATMIAAGLTRQPWYDFRGFHKDRIPEAQRLRDFDEARVQLAADLNGRSPADIQPLWWRNKVREEQARAEREERARRRIEVAECDARLEAANGWYERAFTAFGARNYSAACTCLVEALAVADPARVPQHYERTRERPGWAQSAWALLRYVLALAPRLRALELPPRPEAENDMPRGGLPFLEVQGRAELPVRRLAWGDGGRQLVLMRRSRLEVYELPRGALKATLEPPAGAGAFTAWAAARSTDRIVAGTKHGYVVGWTGSAPPTVVGAHHAAVTAVGIAPDGSASTTGSADGEIRLWPDAASPEAGGSEVVRAGDGQGVTLVAPVQDNREVLFLTGSNLRVKNLASGEEHELHGLVTKPVVAVDDRGETVAYGDWDIVRRSNLREPEDAVLYVGEHRGFIDEIAFSAGGEHLFTRAIRELCVWEGREPPLQRGMSFMGAQMTQTFGTANRGSLLKRLDDLGDVEAITTHPDDPDRFLAMRRGRVAEGHLGFAWRPAARWRPSARGLRSATWLPNGRGVVCGADDGSLSLLSLDGDQTVISLTSFDASVGDTAVSTDGGLVAAVTEDGQVAVHTAPEGRRLAAEQLPSVPFAVAFAAGDGHTVAIGCDDGVIRLWDWRHDGAIRRLGAFDSRVHALAVDPAATTLVAGCENGELAAWDLAKEIQLWSTEDSRAAQVRFGGSVQDVAVAPDGDLVVAGMLLSAVCVLDLATGRERAWIPVRSSVAGKPEQVTAVGMCDDGCTALVGLWDGTLCVVDTTSARELLRFPAHTKVVTAVAQAPGTGDVMTASLDEDPDNDGVRVWTMLDVETVPSPQPVRPEWPATVRTAVERRNGVEDAPDSAEPEEPRADPQAARIPALRAELALEPHSPERNLALAMALIEAGQTSTAQDYVARTHRFGGERLIVDIRAQGLLAVSLLADGKVEDALPWLQRAATGDDPESLMQLGLLCLTGRIHGNDAEGVDYLRRSAELGHVMAAYNLGAYYEQVAAGAVAETDWRQLVFGKSGGTNVHEAEAIKWYQVAADGGNERADEALARLTGPPTSND